MSGLRNWTKVLIRIPPEMKAWLATEAVRNGASQNSEIVRAIRERMERLTPPEATPPAN